MLTEEIKQNSLDICRQLLLLYDREKEHFLNIIVTGDEFWVPHYNPDKKDSQWSFVIRLHRAQRSLKFKRQVRRSS